MGLQMPVLLPSLLNSQKRAPRCATYMGLHLKASAYTAGLRIAWQLALGRCPCDRRQHITFWERRGRCPPDCCPAIHACAGEEARRGRMPILVAPAQCPAVVADLQARCMAQDPAHRPSATEIVEVLRALGCASTPPQPNSAFPPTPAVHSVQEAMGGFPAQPSWRVPAVASGSAATSLPTAAPAAGTSAARVPKCEEQHPPPSPFHTVQLPHMHSASQRQTSAAAAPPARPACRDALTPVPFGSVEWVAPERAPGLGQAVAVQDQELVGLLQGPPAACAPADAPSLPAPHRALPGQFRLHVSRSEPSLPVTGGTGGAALQLAAALSVECHAGMPPVFSSSESCQQLPGLSSPKEQAEAVYRTALAYLSAADADASAAPAVASGYE